MCTVNLRRNVGVTLITEKDFVPFNTQTVFDSLQTLKNNLESKKFSFRSKFESIVCDDLTERHVDFLYEPFKINFIVPSIERHYLPDLVLPNGIIIELKGRFFSDDRKKHLLIKDQYPDLDIRFVFQNPNLSIAPKAKTTVAQWCDKNSFKWADKIIPKAWIKESGRKRKRKRRQQKANGQDRY